MDIKKLKKDIIFSESLRGFEFIFHSTWGLFSPRRVDEGSKLLINHMEIANDDDCLDLGCGYGAIGLAMAKCAPEGLIYLVDKDHVAVEFSKRNTRLNSIENCKVFLSNGFSDIKKRNFNIIASNLPSNVGKELLYIMLYEAKKHLSKGGKLYLVTISGLREFIKRNLLEVFYNYKKVKQGRIYTVALAIKKK
ncbi:class I SAM-dependent methyltransferase [candidate division WOR-3 bacterium]|nr:class I SAM-dependent methyltransferase [candidate division WOR-3 bacterium]